MEKRCNSRVRFCNTIDVVGADRTVTAQIDNISLSGVYVESMERFVPGERVTVIVYLDGLEKPLPLHLKGRISRTDERGFSVRFTEISIGAFVHLRNVIANNVGDYDTVMREFYQYIQSDQALR